MSDVSCSTCRFWIVGQVMGVCRRYPQAHNKHERDWCGEHQAAIVKMVPLVNVKLMDEQPTKKPGRKPKNVVSD